MSDEKSNATMPAQSTGNFLLFDAPAVQKPTPPTEAELSIERELLTHPELLKLEKQLLAASTKNSPIDAPGVTFGKATIDALPAETYNGQEYDSARNKFNEAFKIAAKEKGVADPKRVDYLLSRRHSEGIEPQFFAIKNQWTPQEAAAAEKLRGNLALQELDATQRRLLRDPSSESPEDGNSAERREIFRKTLRSELTKEGIQLPTTNHPEEHPYDRVYCKAKFWQIETEWEKKREVDHVNEIIEKWTKEERAAVEKIDKDPQLRELYNNNHQAYKAYAASIFPTTAERNTLKEKIDTTGAAYGDAIEKMAKSLGITDEDKLKIVYQRYNEKGILDHLRELRQPKAPENAEAKAKAPEMVKLAISDASPGNLGTMPLQAKLPGQGHGPGSLSV